MKVNELISILQLVEDKDIDVLVSGYEGGFIKVREVKTEKVMEFDAKVIPDYCGNFIEYDEHTENFYKGKPELVSIRDCFLIL